MMTWKPRCCFMFCSNMSLSGHTHRTGICFDGKYTVALTEKYWEKEGILGMASAKLSQIVTLNLHSDTGVGLLLKQIRTFWKWAGKKWAKAKHFPLVRHWSSSLPSKSPYLNWEAERGGKGTNGKGQCKAVRETETATHRERRRKEGVKLTAETEGGWSEKITKERGLL